MSALSLTQMRGLLTKSINTRSNNNKINGLLAEVGLREELVKLGYGDRVSVGGWVFRNYDPNSFAKQNIVAFPAVVPPDTSIAADAAGLVDPLPGLSAIASHFHASGISAFACAPTLTEGGGAEDLRWYAKLLGTPKVHAWVPFPSSLEGFTPRTRRYNFLQYNADATLIPDAAVPDEFSKESLRVNIQNALMCEMSDVDGVFFGKHLAYPLEIKEKTGASDKKLGGYFGLDAGPFAKLAFYAAKKGGMLHSLFVVREIVDVKTRALKAWWLITFEELALAASWVPRSGGKNMGGGGSSVIMVPKSAFRPLTATELAKL